MKIAIIGAGRIGAGLARAWASKGHDVVFGARDPKKAELLELASTLGVHVSTVTEAPVGREVVVFAVPYAAVTDVLREVGDLHGRVVIDCTNAVESGMTLRFGHTTSAAEELQKRLPGARVFKSFHAQGVENLANPVYGSQVASNFFCGDGEEERPIVRQLVADVGFDPVDAGPLRNARLIEPMMLLWVSAARILGTRDLAFKLRRR